MYTYTYQYIYIYIYIYIYCNYILQINLPVAFKLANSIQKEGKNYCFVMCNNKKQIFIFEKRRSFLLADIGIFIYFVVLKKKKTKTCSVDSCRSTVFKKEEEKQSEKLDCPAHQIKKCKKKTIFF